MADQQHPSGITLDLFHSEGLRSMVKNGSAELSKATSADAKHRVIDAVIGNLTLLANMGRTELDRLIAENQRPINQDEIDTLLAEFDVAVQEWQLVRQTVPDRTYAGPGFSDHQLSWIV